jgi:hypothetical protein
MDGIIYLLNQAGLALAQANQQIEELIRQLQEASEPSEAAASSPTETLWTQVKD